MLSPFFRTGDRTVASSVIGHLSLRLSGFRLLRGNAAVSMDDAVFENKWSLAFKRCANAFSHQLEIVGMNYTGVTSRAVGDEVGGGVAGDFFNVVPMKCMVQSGSHEHR